MSLFFMLFALWVSAPTCNPNVVIPCTVQGPMQGDMAIVIAYPYPDNEYVLWVIDGELK